MKFFKKLFDKKREEGEKGIKKDKRGSLEKRRETLKRKKTVLREIGKPRRFAAGLLGKRGNGKTEKDRTDPAALRRDLSEKRVKKKRMNEEKRPKRKDNKARRRFEIKALPRRKAAGLL